MATQPFYSPKFRAFDANGDPLAGGKLYSYEAGTSTPLDTFTTRAGNIANSNPVILDANGEADVWTTPGLLYKFVLADALDVIQWTVDNVPSAGTGGGGGGSTGDAAGAVDPGGRLSLTSGTPVTTADVSSTTSIFYVPYKHNMVPLYDGSSWALHEIATELSQALSDATKSPGAAAADNVYDLFVWDDAGTLRVSRGPAWSTYTTRGTGTGTTELERVGGRHVNKLAISNGPGAQRGLYVGTIRTTAGTIVYDSSVAARHLWNAYNRVRRPMRRVETTAEWLYTTFTFRQANGSANNLVQFVLGLSEEPVEAQVSAFAEHISTGSSVSFAAVGIGLDSVTVNSASPTPEVNLGPLSDEKQLIAVYDGFPGIGHHSLAWLEKASASPAGTTRWFGTGTAPALAPKSGIIGSLMA